MIGRLLELALGISGFLTVLLATLPAPFRAKLLHALNIRDARDAQITDATPPARDTKELR